MRAYEAERFEDAAPLFKKAYLHFGEPDLLWNAGRSFEQAGRRDEARAAYLELAQRPYLEPGFRADLDAALERTDVASSRAVVGWTAVGGGSALVITGAILWASGQSSHDDLAAAQAQAGGGPVRSLTRAQAEALDDDGDALIATGVVATLLGIAGVATGIWLLAGDEAVGPASGQVQVSAGPIRGGMRVVVGGAF